jgi:hypothetical protein
VSDDNIAIQADLGPEPWLRLEPRQGRGGRTESAKAYAAFQQYYGASHAERSIRAVAARLGKNRTLLSKWSSRFRWVDRTEAWDRRQSEIAAANLQRQLLQEEELWSKRKKDLREEKYALGKTLRERGAHMLSQPIVEKTAHRTDTSGNQIITLKPNPRMQQTGAGLIRAGFELADQSVGLADTVAGAGQLIDTYQTIPYPPGEDVK